LNEKRDNTLLIINLLPQWHFFCRINPVLNADEEEEFEMSYWLITTKIPGF